MNDNTTLSDSTFDVLAVDDNVANLDLLAKLLASTRYEVRTVPSGSQAIEAAVQRRPDIILLDICMPDMNGYEVCRRLNAHPKVEQVPVIFVSALDHDFDKVKGFHIGGSDYLTKPYQIDELELRLNIHLLLSEVCRQPSWDERERERMESVRERLVHATIEQSAPMRRMINDMVDTRRLEECRMPFVLEEWVLRRLLSESMAQMGLSAERVWVEGERPPVLVSCDRDLTERALVHLLQNALEYSSEDSPVRVTMEQRGEEWRVAIIDEGSGIDPRHHGEIFEPYWQLELSDVEKRPASCGIGLTFSKLAIEAQQGTVSIDSSVGGGARFFVNLPQSPKI